MPIPTPSTNDVLAIARGGSSEDTLDWIRKRADESQYFFSKEIAGYTELTPDLHAPVCEWLRETEALRRRGLLFPRKYFKSSMTKGYITYRVAKNPDIRILFVGENDKVGAKNLQDVKWNIQSNKLFQQLYPDIIPPDMGRTWGDTAITVPRSRSYDEPTIQTIGIGTKHTGFHYNLIVLDDPVGWVASQSKAEMDNAIAWFQALPGLLDSVDSEVLYIGTRWKHGTADLPGWIMKELPFQRVYGRPEGYQWLTRAAIENGVTIFPPQISPSGKRVGYSLRDLAVMKNQMKTYLFNANMMNNPSAEGDSDLPELKTYRIDDDRRSLVLNDTNERVPLERLVRISVYDPSAGGKAAEAENAIGVAGTDYRGRVFVLAMWSMNCGWGRAIEQWHVMNDKWRCWHNHFEAVGAHKEVEELLHARARPCTYCGRDTHLRIRPLPINPPPGSKEDRIRDYLQAPLEEGRVYVAEHMTKLIEQAKQFPYGDLVDELDVLAYLVKKSRRPSIRDDDSEESKKKEEPARKVEPRTHSTVNYGGYA